MGSGLKDQTNVAWPEAGGLCGPPQVADQPAGNAVTLCWPWRNLLDCLSLQLAYGFYTSLTDGNGVKAYTASQGDRLTLKYVLSQMLKLRIANNTGIILYLSFHSNM